MKEKRSKFVEKFKEFGSKVSGIKGIAAVIPAVCLAVLMLTVLTGYQTPKAKKYNASETDVSQIKEALANETTATAKATAATTKKKATKEGKKGAIDLKDGTYKGSANGYGGKVTVNVTISQKTMTAIDIVSAPGETDSFFSRAKEVIDEMLTAQSTDVDVVSGATYSSNGIIGAVKNALYGTESNNATAASASGNNAGGSAPSVSKVNESGTWKDGTYTGSAKGFGGTISVKVTVKDGKISSIDITSAPGETASYFNKAKGIIPKMISGQTTNVDVASGATYSSNGIIKAVRNALSKAGTSKESTKKKKKEKKKKKKNSNDSNAVPSKKYKDGTYTGSGKGYGGTISVKVIVKDGKINDIKVTDASGETDAYFNKAKEIISKMISGQTTNVDVISGATYSSNGIIKAVEDALSKAEVKESGKNTEEQKNNNSDNKNSNNNSSNNSGSNNKNNNTVAPKEGYKDGSYTGSAACKGEEFKEYSVTADVTIKNGKISSVAISSTAKGTNLKQFMSREEIKNLPSLIVSKNGTSGVDAVSGATYSSNAIFSAVNSALANAKKGSSQKTTEKKKDTTTEKKENTTTGKKEETTTQKKEETTTEKKEETTTEKKEETTTEKQEETTEDPNEGKIYKNGNYKVSVTCEPDEDEDFDSYTISMDITIKKDKIIAVYNISANTNEMNKKYVNNAKKGMVSKITSKGTADGVDTVSGATCSSKAIKAACQKAFDAAKK